MTEPFETENVCASDEAAARIGQLQLDLGQGPIWTALALHAPVVALEDGEHAHRWPMFAQAMSEEGMRSIYAFPLCVGSLDIGAVGLYSSESDRMSTGDLAGATQLSRIVAKQVLRRALDGIVDREDGGPDREWSSRREVHQAAGMVIARFGVSADDALAILRAHAFVLGRPVLAVAMEVVARTIDLGADENGS